MNADRRERKLLYLIRQHNKLRVALLAKQKALSGMLSSSRMQFLTHQYIIGKYLLSEFFNLYEQYLQNF